MAQTSIINLAPQASPRPDTKRQTRNDADFSRSLNETKPKNQQRAVEKKKAPPLKQASHAQVNREDSRERHDQFKKHTTLAKTTKDQTESPESNRDAAIEAISANKTDPNSEVQTGHEAPLLAPPDDHDLDKAKTTKPDAVDHKDEQGNLIQIPNQHVSDLVPQQSILPATFSPNQNDAHDESAPDISQTEAVSKPQKLSPNQKIAVPPGFSEPNIPAPETIIGKEKVDPQTADTSDQSKNFTPAEPQNLAAPAIAPEKAETKKLMPSNLDIGSGLGQHPSPHLHPLPTNPDLNAANSAPQAAPTHTPVAKQIPYVSLPLEIGIRAADGTKELSLDLTPKDLGKLNVTIAVNDQSPIQISFTAEHPQTLALLQHDALHIRHLLEQAGFSTHESSLQFSLRQDTSSHSGSPHDDGKRPKRRNLPSVGFDASIDATPPRSRLSLTRVDVSI